VLLGQLIPCLGFRSSMVQIEVLKQWPTAAIVEARLE